MSDIDTARRDIAFLKDLVDDDWRSGLRAFGAIYVVVGVTICLHVAIMELTAWEGPPLLAAFVALYGVCSLFVARIARRFRPTEGGGVRNRAGGAAMLGAFAAHLVMLAVLVIVAVRQDNALFVQLAPLVLFASQGAMWLVVQATRRARWHLAEALGWYAAAIALAPLVGTAAFGPALAAALIVLMVVPGAYMMRLARTPESA